MGSVAHQIVDLDLRLAAGINHEGINAEVAKGQWEFQIFAKGSKKAADNLWIARYLRDVGGKEYLEALMQGFQDHIAEHIAVYGPDNHLRLTGLHGTQAIDKFSYGLSDRGASVRLPVNFIKNGYRGYLEDRRPNSEADPYQIVY